jgi:DNA-binding MarR family transcriptional regulator
MDCPINVLLGATRVTRGLPIESYEENGWPAARVQILDGAEHAVPQGKTDAGELAELTGLTTGATRLIDRLEQSGHVRRTADSTDRRRVLVEQVPGSLDLDAVVGPARRHLGEVLAGFTAADLKVLFTYFKRPAPAFHQAAEKIRRTRKRDSR